jgi:hypothetical protein
MIEPGKMVKDAVVGVFVYARYRSAVPAECSGKSVFLDIKDNVYHRYLYLFVKFFHLEGYTVYIKAHPVALRYIYHFDQARLIIKEKIAHFSFRKISNCDAYLSDSTESQRLSPDYFSDLVLGAPKENDFYVPMAMHPYMYYRGLWNQAYEPQKKLRSIFFAGNCNRVHYTIAPKDNVFNIVDRVRMHDLLLTQSNTFFPKSLEELETRKEEKEIVMVVKGNFMVPMERLRQVLSQYTFFLACPGYVMPFSHNIVEAMSVGAIPIIQASYARLFQPPLEHGKNAFLFEDEQDLLKQVNQALHLSDKTIAFLAKGSLDYYEQYLTPKSVVNHLLERSYDHIYLIAELPSVNLLKKAVQKANKISGDLKKITVSFFFGLTYQEMPELAEMQQLGMMVL